MTWEFKLEPNTEQISEIERILSVCRSVWNFALQERKDWLDSRKSPIDACRLRGEYILPADQPFPNYQRQAKCLTTAKQTLFVEDLDFRVMAKGMLGKHTLDAGLGQFNNQILPWVCWKRDVFYGKVDPRGTSQECPDCGASINKDLSVRVSHCPVCGSIKPRDVAAAQVICTRGQRGIENACGVEVTGMPVTGSSQLALKQELFGVTQGISLHTADSVAG